MKKLLCAFMIVSTFVLPDFAVNSKAEEEASAQSANVPQTNYDSVSQELERNRELLEIWKDHVKTLTRERDEATRELESLKGQGPEAGVAETETRIVQDPEQQKKIETLASQVEELKAQNENLLRSQKELESKGKTENDEKTASLNDQISRLQSQNEHLRDVISKAQSAAPQVVKDPEQDRKIVELSSQLSQLKFENDRLRSQAPAPSVDAEQENKIRELNSEVSQLKYENESLKLSQKEVQTLQAEKAELLNDKEDAYKKIQDLRSQLAALGGSAEKNEKLAVEKEEEIRKIRAEYDDLLVSSRAEQDKLKLRIASLETDGVRARSFETDLERARSEKEMADKAFLALQNDLKLKEERFRNEAAAYQKEAEKARSEKQNAEAEVLALGNDIKLLETRTNAEINSLKEAVAKAQSDREASEKNYASLLMSARTEQDKLRTQLAGSESALQKLKLVDEDLQKTRTDLETLQQAYDSLLVNSKSEQQKLKAEIAVLQTDGLRAKSLEEVLNKTRADKESMAKSYASLVDSSKTQEQKLTDLSYKISKLQKGNEEMAGVQAVQTKTIENLQAALQSNLVDLQGLKSNFEAYLESLVENFNKRQK